MSLSATRYPRAQIARLIERIEVAVGADLDAISERREWAGSYRRRRPTCGDLDLIVLPKPGVSSDAFTPILIGLTDGLLAADGQTIKRGFLRRSGIALDMVIARPETPDLLAPIPSSWGVCLLTRTGPLAFNTLLARRARMMGFRYSPFDGIYRLADGSLVCSADEAECLDTLGLPWIPPEDRDRYE